MEATACSAACKTMRQRKARAWGVERARTRASSWSRVASDKATVEPKGRGMAGLLAGKRGLLCCRRTSWEATPPLARLLATNLRNGHLGPAGLPGGPRPAGHAARRGEEPLAARGQAAGLVPDA